MVEYFSTTRWDGAVDLSWYNGTDTEFTLTTPPGSWRVWQSW